MGISRTISHATTAEDSVEHSLLDLTKQESQFGEEVPPLPTLFDLCKDMRLPDSTETVKDILTPAPFLYTVEGLHLVPADQLASLQLPLTEYDNLRVVGFQRDTSRRAQDVRKIARALEAGKEFPPILVSRNEYEQFIVTDGAARSVGGMMTLRPMWVVLNYRDNEASQAIFADQDMGRKVPNDILIVSGSSPYHRYIKDALENASHPWHDIVGPGKIGGPGSNSKITPSQMMRALMAYVGNQAGVKANLSDITAIEDRWDPKIADELALLVKAFGTRQTNPDAFSSKSLAAIGIVATLAIRRTGRSVVDIRRWQTHMPSFQFALFRHLNSTQLTESLIGHWNKRLHEGHRIMRPRS